MLSDDDGLLRKVDRINRTSLNEESKFKNKHFDVHLTAPLQRRIHYIRCLPTQLAFGASRDRIVVNTLHCSHNNSGSNNGQVILLTVSITA